MIFGIEHAQPQPNRRARRTEHDPPRFGVDVEQGGEPFAWLVVAATILDGGKGRGAGVEGASGGHWLRIVVTRSHSSINQILMVCKNNCNPIG